MDDTELADHLRHHAAGLRQHATTESFLSNAKMLAERRHGDLPVQWFESLFDELVGHLEQAADRLEQIADDTREAKFNDR